MEDFVPFEIAKQLKEKGFREECFAHYPICGGDYEEYNCIEDDRCGISLFDLCRCYNNEDSRLIDAPTISQVLKWLREEKELHIEIYMYRNCYLWEIYNTKIYDVDFIQKLEKYSEIECENYEQAAIAGIEYVIDNLI